MDPAIQFFLFKTKFLLGPRGPCPCIPKTLKRKLMLLLAFLPLTTLLQTSLLQKQPIEDCDKFANVW